MTADSSQISVRGFTPDDLDCVIELFKGSVRRIAKRDYNPQQIAAWAPDQVNRDGWLARRLAKPTWIAEIAGTITGFTDLEPDGHIDMFYVHADHQGRRVGATLLYKVEAAAREAGLKRLFTEASITARPFFEHCGFKVLVQQVVDLRGQHFTNYKMDKQLDI